MKHDLLLAQLDCMTPGQAALFNQPEAETYTGRAAAAIRELRAELAEVKVELADCYEDLALNCDECNWSSRADRAEQDVARLRAELVYQLALREYDRAAIARIRELCAEADGAPRTFTVRGLVEDVYAALEGNQP